MKKILDNKTFQIIYKILKTIFVVILALFLLFAIVQKISNNKDVMGYRVFSVATGSMAPVYEVGDVIFVKTVDPLTLKVGDDITYQGLSGDFEGKIVTHRIIKILDNNRIQTKGTANQFADPIINTNQVFGKVEYKSTIFSFLSNLVHNKVSFFFLIFVPIVLIAFLEVADFIYARKKYEN